MSVYTVVNHIESKIQHLLANLKDGAYSDEVEERRVVEELGRLVRRIASGSWDKTVQVWDAADGGHVVTYHGYSSDVYAVEWSPDGRRIASGSLG